MGGGIVTGPHVNASVRNGRVARVRASARLRVLRWRGRGALPVGIRVGAPSLWSTVRVAALVVTTDALQYCAHRLTHVARSSSAIHHEHVTPRSVDAFRTGVSDAIVQLMCPSCARSVGSSRASGRLRIQGFVRTVAAVHTRRPPRLMGHGRACGDAAFTSPTIEAL